MYRNAVYIVYFKLENKKLMDKSKLIMWAQSSADIWWLTLSSEPCHRFPVVNLTTQPRSDCLEKWHLLKTWNEKE